MGLFKSLCADFGQIIQNLDVTAFAMEYMARTIAQLLGMNMFSSSPSSDRPLSTTLTTPYPKGMLSTSTALQSSATKKSGSSSTISNSATISPTPIILLPSTGGPGAPLEKPTLATDVGYNAGYNASPSLAASSCSPHSVPVRISSLLDLLTNPDAPRDRGGSRSRIDRFELDVTGIVPSFARHVQSLSPAACVDYMLLNPGLFMLTGLQDHDPHNQLLVQQSRVSENPLVSLTIVLLPNQGINTLNYFTVLCVNECEEKAKEEMSVIARGSAASLSFAGLSAPASTLGSQKDLLPSGSYTPIPSSLYGGFASSLVPPVGGGVVVGSKLLRPFGDSPLSPSLGLFSSFFFEAEQRVASMFAKFCTLRFMDWVWAQLPLRLPGIEGVVSSDEWMVFLAQHDSAAVSIESLDVLDASLSSMLSQLVRVWPQLCEFLQARFPTRCRTIEIKPISTEYENMLHIVLLHERTPRLAVLLRNDTGAHRLYAYTIVCPPSSPETRDLFEATRREFASDVVNILCVFMWTRLMGPLS